MAHILIMASIPSRPGSTSGSCYRLFVMHSLINPEVTFQPLSHSTYQCTFLPETLFRTLPSLGSSASQDAPFQSPWLVPHLPDLILEWGRGPPGTNPQRSSLPYLLISLFINISTLRSTFIASAQILHSYEVSKFIFPTS